MKSAAPESRALSRGLGLFATAILALGALSVALMLSTTAPPVRAASVSIHLYGSAASGWGLSPTTETNPGPTLTVNRGDVVTMELTSTDGLQHTFWVDYNGNGVPDVGEPNSPLFSGTINYTFTANVAVTAPYYCGVHSLPGNPSSPMRGTWITNAPPTTGVTQPTGTSDWTGGSTHDIAVSASDDGPLSGVTLWVNYSANGGTSSGTIAGPVGVTSATTTFAWVLPVINATDARINVTAVDAMGAKSFSTSSAFVIDSSPPVILSSTPGDGATGVVLNAQVRVAFTEPMNESRTGLPGAFGVRSVASGAWTAGSVSWSSTATQLTFRPTSPFAPMTQYEAQVNTSASDASDPGNPLASTATWTFTTGSTADATPPVFQGWTLDPAMPFVSAPANLTVVVSDNDRVASVFAHIVGRSFDANLSLTSVGGSTWYLNRTYAAGNYTFTLWASDPAGNIASRTGSFAVVSSANPPGPPAGSDLSFLVYAGVATAIIVAALVALIRRRRRSR